MADRPRQLSTGELERRLAALDPSTTFPPTPDLARAVTARLGPATLRSTRGLGFPANRRRVVLVLAALLLLLAAVAAATRLSIGGVSIREGSPDATGSTIPETLALGMPVSLSQAERRLGTALDPPAALGAPDAVFLDEPEPGRVRVTLAWAPRAGIPPIEGLAWGAVLTELRGAPELAAKTLYVEGESHLQPASVDGGDAVWLTGRHELDVTTSEGPVRYRITGNVLLWARGSLTLRLESEVSKARAEGVAASIPE